MIPRPGRHCLSSRQSSPGILTDRGVTPSSPLALLVYKSLSTPQGKSKPCSTFELRRTQTPLSYQSLEVLTIFQDRREQGIDFAEALFGLVFEALKNKERAYEAFLEAARVFKNNGYSKDHPHLVKAVNKAKRLAR